MAPVAPTRLAPLALALLAACSAPGAPTTAAPSDAGAGRRESEVRFASGEVRLVGTLTVPIREQPVPALVVLHSASGGRRDAPVYAHLRERLPARGIAVLVFDRRGHGASTGDFRTADFDDLAADAVAAVEALAARPEIDGDRVGVWGLSQGGWIAPLAAVRSERVACVVSLSGPGVSPAEQMRYSAETAIRAAGHGEAAVERAAALRDRVDDWYRGRADRAEVQQQVDEARAEPWFELAYLPRQGVLPEDARDSKWFQELDHDPLPVLARVDVPLLCLFGERDVWVPVEESLRRIRAATEGRAHVTAVSIAGADHDLMVEDAEAPGGRRPSDAYLARLDSWLDEHLAP